MADPLARRRLRSRPDGRSISADDPAPYGWAPLVVLFVVGLVDRVENSLLAGTLPLIQAEWGFSDTAAGSIPTAAAIASALVALPAGYLTDRYNRTRIITIVVFCWALATLGSGLAVGFAMFYAARVLLAAAEQVDNPASSSLLADYYPQVSRPKVYGLVRMTTYLGGIGTVLGGVLGQALGWRSTFIIMAVPGVLAALLMLTLREPVRGRLDALMARSSRRSSDRPAEDEGTDAPPAAAPPFGRQLRQVLRIPTLVLVSFGLMLLTAGLLGIYYWMPSLIVRAFGAGAGTAGSITGGVSVIGVVLGTFIGAWVGRWAHEAIRGGRVLVGGSVVVVASLVLALALSSESLVTYSILLLLSTTISSIAIPCVTASIADVVGAGSRGIGFAVLQFLLTAGGAAGPVLVGVVSDLTGSLRTALYVLTVPMVIGGLLMAASRWSYEQDAERVLEAARS